MKIKVSLYLLIVLGLLLLSACGSGANNAAENNQQGAGTNSVGKEKLETIRMASWSQPLVEQSNLYLAEEKGWFQEAGVQFEYIPGAGGGDAVKQLLAGNADIAFANLEAVLLAAEQGAKLKIIYNIYPHNVFNLVSLQENKVTSMQDLKGKKVGVYSLSSGTYDNLRVLLYSAGMTENDVEVIATGVLNFGPLMNNQVVATAATDTGLFDAKLKGLGEVDVLEVKDFLNTPSDLFVVTEETFNQKHDLLIRFLQVYRNSVAYTLEHPEEAAQAAVSKAIDGQDVERNREIIKIRNNVSSNEQMKEKGLGWLDLEILEQVEATYVEMGLLQQEVGIKNMVTNELVEALN